MIEQTIKNMNEVVLKMQESISLDIEDIKQAKHEKLLERNEEKQIMIDTIAQHKQQLNELLVKAIQEGEDVNVYRDKVDELEEELKTLYKLNARLASIVLPIQKMYKDIVEDLTAHTGGNIIEIKA
jgi:DNA repair exonuclease SbcCD ATPase subunit